MSAIHCAITASQSNGVGPELVVNGSFSVDSDWVKGADWTISGGAANYNSPGSGTLIRQQFNDRNYGNTYRLTYSIVSGSGTVYATITTSQGSFTYANRTGIGTYVEDLLTYDIGALSMTLRFNASGPSAASIDNVSVVRVY